MPGWHAIPLPGWHGGRGSSGDGADTSQVPCAMLRSGDVHGALMRPSASTRRNILITKLKRESIYLSLLAQPCSANRMNTHWSAVLHITSGIGALLRLPGTGM